MTVRERVFQAADELTGEGERITAASVRERARCSMADASRYLREWREHQAAREAPPVPAIPTPVSATGERAVAAIWAAATTAAREEYEAVRQAAAAEVSAARAEVDELATEVDRARGDAEAMAGELERVRADLTAARDSASQTAEDARVEAMALRAEIERIRGELDTARDQVGEARAAQAAAEGLVGGLREALAQLTTKITPKRPRNQ